MDTRVETRVLSKARADIPAIALVGRGAIGFKPVILSATSFRGRNFTTDTQIPDPEGGYVAGVDYIVLVGDQDITVTQLALPLGAAVIGGFHFAPGGNATARAGGDREPAINPFSIWDLNFRPACENPGGMTFVRGLTGPFWTDIYLLGVNHLVDGTSKLGATIADGDGPPQRPDSGYFDRFDYDTACAVMRHHGKGLLSVIEFFDAAIGVTEKTATPRKPLVTALDAARTSRAGLMQATGNMWVWGHDGDPDMPRASVFGGSWGYGGGAGSRYAVVAWRWPEVSYDLLGARGRGDHLQLD